jgi:hypothetical protein
MEKILRNPSSFRLSPEVLAKLEKIREFHMERVNRDAYNIEPYPFTTRMVLQGLIENEYLSLVQEGRIVEE